MFRRIEESLQSIYEKISYKYIFMLHNNEFLL